MPALERRTDSILASLQRTERVPACRSRWRTHRAKQCPACQAIYAQRRLQGRQAARCGSHDPNHKAAACSGCQRLYRRKNEGSQPRLPACRSASHTAPASDCEGCLQIYAANRQARKAQLAKERAEEAPKVACGSLDPTHRARACLYCRAIARTTYRKTHADDIKKSRRRRPSNHPQRIADRQRVKQLRLLKKAQRLADRLVHECNLCNESTAINIVFEDADYGLEVAWACSTHKQKVQMQLATRVAEKMQDEGPLLRAIANEQKKSAVKTVRDAIETVRTYLESLSAAEREDLEQQAEQHPLLPGHTLSRESPAFQTRLATIAKRHREQHMNRKD